MRHAVLLVWLCVVRQVCCEDLPPPRDVQVNSSLTWAPDPQHTNVKYTVQHRSLSFEWQDVPSCVSTMTTSCDVMATQAASFPYGCVELRVHAHTHTLTSRPASACSTQGGVCSPGVQLSSHPGSLAVSVRPHPLSAEYGGQLQLEISYGLEGEPLKVHVKSPASVILDQLQKGRTYCVEVQLLYYLKRLGPPSCLQCVAIPLSGEETKYTQMVFVVVSVIISVVGATFLLYVCLFHVQNIKRWIKGPYKIPEFLIKSQPLLHPISSTHCEDCCDTISLMVSLEELNQRSWASY